MVVSKVLYSVLKCTTSMEMQWLHIVVCYSPGSVNQSGQKGKKRVDPAVFKSAHAAFLVDDQDN
jgi:hypothetical protein